MVTTEESKCFHSARGGSEDKGIQSALAYSITYEASKEVHGTEEGKLLVPKPNEENGNECKG